MQDTKNDYHFLFNYFVLLYLLYGSYFELYCSSFTIVLFESKNALPKEGIKISGHQYYHTI